MTAVQLRRFMLVPEHVEAFVEWWTTEVVPVREQHSFEVLFGYLDRERSEFTWAISHDGDFDVALAEYYASSEWKLSHRAGRSPWMSGYEESMVDVIR